MTQFTAGVFYNVNDQTAFSEGFSKIAKSLKFQDGIFAGDNLFVYNRTLGFLEETKFRQAIAACNPDQIEQSMMWRSHTLCWAAKQVYDLPGDFVEAGCYKGYTERVLCNYVGIPTTRQYWLYDLFYHDEAMDHHPLPAHSNSLFDQVKSRFVDLPNVHVIQGELPASFAQGMPEKIALLHLDLNGVDAEIAVLEQLYDRVLPSGVIVLDDFGWAGYRAQHDAELAWFAAHGKPVLELPTGQGLIIR